MSGEETENGVFSKYQMQDYKLLIINTQSVNVFLNQNKI